MPEPAGATSGSAGYEYPPLRGGKLLLLTAAIATASFMEILDMTIVNVSVPAISGSLGVVTSEGTWAVSSYMLAAAIMQPLSGWIARRFGEVRTFVTSVLLFMLFSAICGLAVSLPMLVAARLIQGLVSGPMMSVAQAILLRNYPIERRGMAIALWSMVIMIAPICGPVLGGYITDNLSWPWLFYINLPVGTFSAVVTWWIMRHRESMITKLPIDVVGLVLLVIGVGSLQFMLDNGNEKDWFNSSVILAAAAVAIISISFLIPWELTDKHPVVGPAFVRSAQLPHRHRRPGSCLFRPVRRQHHISAMVADHSGLHGHLGGTGGGACRNPGDCRGAFRRQIHGPHQPQAGRQLRLLRVRRRDPVDGDSERDRQFRRVRHAALPAGSGDGVFLPAAQSNHHVRGCTQ